MGWQEQLAAVEGDLLSFDKDLRDLEERIRRADLPIPDFLKSDFIGMVGQARAILDAIFTPVIEADVVRDFTGYLRSVQSHHQQHIVHQFPQVAATLADGYETPDEYAQYRLSAPQAHLDSLNIDAAVADLATYLDTVALNSDFLIAALGVLLGLILVIAGTVALMVATGLLTAPAGVPAALLEMGGAGLTLGSVGEFVAACMSALAAASGIALPTLGWIFVATGAVVLLHATGADKVLVQTGTEVVEWTEEQVQRLMRLRDHPDNPNKPNEGDDPWPIPIPIPEDKGTRTRTRDQQCGGPKDQTRWALALGTEAPSLELSLIAKHPTYHCFIMNELADIVLGNPAASGNISTLEAYLMLKGEPGGVDHAKYPAYLFMGAFFQMQWIHDHLSRVKAVEPIWNDSDNPTGSPADGVNYGHGYQGADAELTEPVGHETIVEFKSVEDIRTADMKAQMEKDQRMYPGRPIHFVFDENKAHDIPQPLKALFAQQVPPVTYEFYKPTEDITKDGTVLPSYQPPQV